MADTAPTPEQLEQARTYVSAEIARTDTKAAALLTGLSLPIAGLVAALPGRDIDPPAAIGVGLGALGLVAAMLTILFVVRPRLTGTNTGYLNWAEAENDAAVAADIAADHRVEHIVQLSRIARAKYQALRVAIDTAAAAMAVLVISLLTTLI
ncbi:Pycsar system effector family protein [Streptomyces sp. MP131-18]|uniref:Pycsar system effector family protein n=1 Tax=Streptomyces sp. MP131-18 TaxID=1857892 RepID=UPI00097C1BED|nr:Pycsar system effector family protein [Streptomyces sp. MP131-18]ONK09272.1 hypothetical protein STBA_71270 [Streptomyces sp. MP131-18]